MTKLTDVLLKKARNSSDIKTKWFQSPTYRHRMIARPNVLGNKVAVANVAALKDPCQDLLQQMLSCWKKNEFKENTCQDEYAKYALCLTKFRTKLEAAAAFSEQTELGEGANQRLNPKIANRLLSMYSQPPYEVKITHELGKPMTKPRTFKGKTDTNQVHERYQDFLLKKLKKG
ncbi:coiled-coil-helix-coiled-coil-helix domain-containing protein 1-like [Mya arenaria]|uniref:coiled-coil-helix-coiled-coil-helix domain-containing protein 1-like n=1 Tax=Mya arenaria TaxID=6604 RepID=UPI0022E141F7|nr:coiled-coil-helix-coiled-coil-helix domain-containing protein 1-like [Mya arenaria]XP_052820628.1 coiled-coil-helix-coiled-coil-helix domain-containing protein 1-like [Mya arenaria]